MYRANEYDYWVVKVILAVLTFFILWICLTGCQTVRGLASDGGSVCDYVMGQIPPQDSTRDMGDWK